MRDIFIIPKNRDRTSKIAYQFLDWYFRKNKILIRKQFREAYQDYFLNDRNHSL